MSWARPLIDSCKEKGGMLGGVCGGPEAESTSIYFCAGIWRPFSCGVRAALDEPFMIAQWFCCLTCSHYSQVFHCLKYPMITLSHTPQSARKLSWRIVPLSSLYRSIIDSFQRGISVLTLPSSQFWVLTFHFTLTQQSLFTVLIHQDVAHFPLRLWIFYMTASHNVCRCVIHTSHSFYWIHIWWLEITEVHWCSHCHVQVWDFCFVTWSIIL